MLKTLRDLNTRDAQSVLAAVTNAFLPRPTETPSVIAEEYGDLPERVLREAQQKLKVASFDSPKDRSRLLRLLADEMTAYANRDVDIAQVKARIGQQGNLPASRYDIQFRPNFDRTIGIHSISKNQIEDAVRNPDNVEHLLQEQVENLGLPAISLYIKVRGSLGHPNTFILLVESERRGNVQVISRAYRVYYSDVDLSTTKSPLDVLRAFVDKYGIELSVLERAYGKFLLYTTIPIGAEYDYDIDKMARLFNTNIDPDHVFQGSTLFRRISSTTLAIAVVYIIDISKYHDDLRKHNVQIPNLKPGGLNVEPR